MEKILYNEVAKISGKNESTICELMKEKESHTDFAVTLQKSGPQCTVSA